MIREEVLELINDFLNENIFQENETISEDSNFHKDLGLDTLDVIELIIYIEKELKISIPDEVILDFETVGDLIDVVLKQM